MIPAGLTSPTKQFEPDGGRRQYRAARTESDQLPAGAMIQAGPPSPSSQQV